MDVFSSFPNAIVSNRWELGRVVRATVGGNEFKNPVLCDVIVDEGSYADADRAPRADEESSDTLLYARPEQMPTLATTQLTNGYFWHDKLNDLYYAIREASLGQNQETGVTEHVEFLLRPTEALTSEGDDE